MTAFTRPTGMVSPLQNDPRTAPLIFSNLAPKTSMSNTILTSSASIRHFLSSLLDLTSRTSFPHFLPSLPFLTSCVTMEIIEINDSSSDDASASATMASYQLYVDGKPTSLPRPRFFRNGIFNPAGPAAKVFKQSVRQQLPQVNNGILFDITVPLTVTIVFFMPRPRSDFVGARRAPGNLKPTASVIRFLPVCSDVDNLSKFVLDALNGLVYHDDRQVVKLVAIKLRDNNSFCRGGTRVVVSRFLAGHLENSL